VSGHSDKGDLTGGSDPMQTQASAFLAGGHARRLAGRVWISRTGTTRERVISAKAPARPVGPVSEQQVGRPVLVLLQSAR
jgi:hypothetical protein